jgi:hypothetical protein
MLSPDGDTLAASGYTALGSVERLEVWLLDLRSGQWTKKLSAPDGAVLGLASPRPGG